MTYSNFKICIKDAEGNTDTVNRAIKQGFTDNKNKLSNILLSLYEPEQQGYNKVYMTLKSETETFIFRRDLSRTEDTPASIIIELEQYDKELKEARA